MTNPTTPSGVAEPAAITSKTLRIGAPYNWKNQPERLIFVGTRHYPDNGDWHQFALVNKPDTVWCEVRESDLSSFEETPVAASQAASHSAPAEPAGWREALQFYANGDHFMQFDPSAWESVSGEPANFLEDESNTAMVEDGSVAKAALSGTPLRDDDPVGAETVAPEDFDKMSGDLTRAKNLLVRLHNVHPATRPMIEGATGSWFVWGQDRGAQAPSTEPASKKGGA